MLERLKTQVETQKRDNTDAGTAKRYAVEVVLTHYDRGNSFARFMLAGLGQINIEAHVSVFELPQRIRTADFDIDKRFAWGGFYGGSTRIEDVEPAFAEGLAIALTSPKDIKRVDANE